MAIGCFSRWKLAEPPAPQGEIATIPTQFHGTWFNKALSQDCLLKDDEVSMIVSAGQAGSLRQDDDGTVTRRSHSGDMERSIENGVLKVDFKKYEVLGDSQLLVDGELYVKGTRPTCDPTFVGKKVKAAAEAAAAAPAADGSGDGAAAAASGQVFGVGTEQKWGEMTAKLNSGSVKGKTASFEILLTNNGSESDNISSLGMLQVTSDEGDQGTQDFMRTKCDGAIAPGGKLKCIGVFTFDVSVKSVTVQVGAGILTPAVYFKL